MKPRDKDEARMLREALETIRELRNYWELPKAGKVHRVKMLLRRAGVPTPRPRREPAP
jgi:hypothetical protein